MNKKLAKCITIIAIPCVLLAAGYFALMRYYQQYIPYGTWINGIYCTGFSREEANKMLLLQNSFTPSLIVEDMEGREYVLTPDSSLYDLDYMEPMTKEFMSYGLSGVFRQKDLVLLPKVYIHREAFPAYLKVQPLWEAQPAETEGERVRILKTERGFELEDHCRDLLDRDKAAEAIMNGFETGAERVSLKEEGCYYSLDYTEEEKELLFLFDALQSFTERIAFDLTIQGEPAERIDASVLCDWIMTDSDGSYVFGKDGVLLLDSGKVKRYADTIAETYTTYFGKPWTITAHDGSEVEVAAGNYGRKMNGNALYQYLLDSFEYAVSEDYELEFTFYPESARENDYGAGYGDSYVEVDIEEQHLYVYIDGELALDSDIVTGDVSRHRETPKGTFYIEYKQRDRVLHGADYDTLVHYWMHFYNHCGFHDAYWRGSFGGQIYVYGGSHGCVNMPSQKAKEMYDLVSADMPVFVY